MRTNSNCPPELAVKTLSKVRSKGIAKIETQNLRHADFEADPVLVQQSLQLMRAAIRATKKALPGTDPELIGGFFADLLDLWETGQKLDKQLQKLEGLRFPRDRERLRDILIWISAIQIDMAAYWIGEINKDLPKLLQALDRLDREHTSNKQERMPAKKTLAKKPKSAKHTPTRKK